MMKLVIYMPDNLGQLFFRNLLFCQTWLGSQISSVRFLLYARASLKHTRLRVRIRATFIISSLLKFSRLRFSETMPSDPSLVTQSYWHQLWSQSFTSWLKLLVKIFINLWQPWNIVLNRYWFCWHQISSWSLTSIKL